MRQGRLIKFDSSCNEYLARTDVHHLVLRHCIQVAEEHTLVCVVMKHLLVVAMNPDKRYATESSLMGHIGLLRHPSLECSRIRESSGSKSILDVNCGGYCFAPELVRHPSIL